MRLNIAKHVDACIYLASKLKESVEPVPATALCRPSKQIQVRIAEPMRVVFVYPQKRSYNFSDMAEVANRIIRGHCPVPLTTLDFWLKKAELISRGRGARTSVYSVNDLILFTTYCACQSAYENSQQANRAYAQLTNY
jgi:hypothetical protein